MTELPEPLPEEVQDVMNEQLSAETQLQDTSDELLRAMRSCEKAWQALTDMSLAADDGYELGAVRLLLVHSQSGPRELNLPLVSVTKAVVDELWRLTHEAANDLYLQSLRRMQETSSRLLGLQTEGQ